jgi:hypothetical protein
LLKVITVLGGAGFIAWRFLRDTPGVPDKLKPGTSKQEEPAASGGAWPAALQTGGPASSGQANSGSASTGSASFGSASSGSTGSGSSPAGASSANGEPGTTKAELYERAKQLGIEGRSKMSKQDLKRAIREAG